MLTTAATVWAGCTAAMAAAEWWHRRSVQQVRHRILISGMRGKSTVVRLLHAAFRAKGCTVLARITGDDAIHLMPDGAERPVRRWGPPNIREMRRTARLAAARRCDVVCIENMAIDPELVRLASTHILQPTLLLHCVDGTDHTEHYPADAGKRARLIVRTWPNGVPAIVVNSDRNTAILDAARECGHQILQAPASDSPHLRPFMRELVGAVNAAVEYCLNCPPSENAITEAAIDRQYINAYNIEGRPVVDLLSANDPETTVSMIELLLAEKRIEEFLVVYLHRGDRPGRLLSFEYLLRRFPSVITGDSVPWSYRRQCHVPFSPGIEHVLRDFQTPLFLAGNRHSSQEQRLKHLFAKARLEKW